MLANVEKVKMEAEGSQLSQQGIDKRLRQPLAAIRHQARSQHNQIRLKLRRILVRTLNPRSFAAALQAVKHVGKKTPVKLHRVARTPEHGGSGQRSFILRQSCQNFGRSA